MTIEPIKLASYTREEMIAYIRKLEKENYDLKGAFQRVMKKYNHLKTK